MKNTVLKTSLIAQADESFLLLTQQVQYLLDLIDFYTVRYQIDETSRVGIQFNPSIQTLGSVPYQLAGVIARFRTGEPRVLSREGVELELINELWCTMETLFLFFVGQDLQLEPYDRQAALRAIETLRISNRLLP
jgi:hypothetical protein